MTPQLRRQLALILVSAAGTLVGLQTAAWLLVDACLDAGGRWGAAARACEMPAGAPAPGTPARVYLVAVVAGLLTTLVLWRTYTFFATRGRRRTA